MSDQVNSATPVVTTSEHAPHLPETSPAPNPPVDAPSGADVSHSNGDHPTKPSVAPASPEVDVNAPYGLTTAERNWSRLYPDLEAKGYRLRPRYRPGWVGSWVGNSKNPDACEDSIELRGPGIVIDAVRVKDGRQVLLKLWYQDALDGPEKAVLQYFSDPSRKQDPANHVVPLLEVLTIPEWEASFDGILVEPLLKAWDEPPFVMVAEGLSFILQLLEGLEYMHSHNITHGDIHNGNIMMDPAPMYPRGFHGAFNFNPERRISERALPRRTRIQAPVKYYFIDFGSGAIFPSFEERRPMVSRAAVWQPPEWSSERNDPIDPFKADVYVFGLFLATLFESRPGLQFVAPTFMKALSPDPQERHTAAELKADFMRLLSAVKPSLMRERIGWSRTSTVLYQPPTLAQRAWDYCEYIKVLWHSYRYGLPKELFVRPSEV